MATTFRRSPKNAAQGAKVPVRTVHAVKGETYDTTILYAPFKKKCISETWWSPDDALGEERRIAFVATTRSRNTFVLVVTTATANNLKKLKPDFYAAFQPIKEADYTASLRI